LAAVDLVMEQAPSNRLEQLIRERARLDAELECCRELVAVLFVDIVGSTRFYDENGDVAGLVMVQKSVELLVPPIEQHGGTVIKTIGDAILARFCDAEPAVLCAIEMQRNLSERNRGRSAKDEIHVRVAINVGFALLTDNDVFGDVVNVASRIEGATESDEINISASVYEKIRHLPNIPVRKKASAVELKGKVGKLDLYAIGWKPEERAGPPPPLPSNEQLAIATGLHTGLADLAKRGSLSSVTSKPHAPPQEAHSFNKTRFIGSSEIGERPKEGPRFVIARVGPDGTLGKRYPLDRPGMVAGQEGEISLCEDPLVAPQHARFTQLGDGVYVEDLGSPRGVFLGLREPYRLRDGDTILIGQQRFRMMLQPTDVSAASNVTPDRTAVLAASPLIGRLPGSLVRINSNDEEDGRYMLHVAETSFGRAKGTYTFPDDLYMSTAHARIIAKGDQYLVEDLASTNGTFVRIRKRVLTRNGDTLLVGKQLLRVLAQQSTPVTD
jgi:class 3 adenylate cyclase/pSer/pThr/pTyr-binding forkhead associated (FHA) protein